jgi:hypothetical protein
MDTGGSLSIGIQIFASLWRRVLAVALASSELVGVAETARARIAWSSSRLLKRQLSLPVSMMSHRPASPWQIGFAERLIVSIRRECLDHIVVFGEAQR